MPLLSLKQLQELRASKQLQNGTGAAEDRVKPVPAAPRPPTKTWTFMFPEVIVSAPKNFELKVRVPSGEKSFKCEDDYVRTDDPELAAYLAKAGYIQMHVKENK